MTPDPSEPPAVSDPPAPRLAIPLEYHRPVKTRGIDVGPYLGKALGAAAMLLGGVVFLLPVNNMQPFGLALAFAGGGWWVWNHRPPSMSWLVRLQLVGAAALCSFGLLTVAMGMDGARPPGPSYWFTENQAYSLTRSRVLKPLWISLVGMAWLVLVGIVVGIRILLRARNRRRRNAG